MFGLDDWIAGLSDGASLLVVVLVATLLGLRHATDPDHIAAMTTLVASGRERVGRGAIEQRQALHAMPAGGGRKQQGYQRFALDLWWRVACQLCTGMPQPVTNAGAGTPGPPRALIGAVVRDRRQSEIATALMVSRAPNQPAVDHHSDAGNGERGLGHVGGQHDLAPPAGLEDAGLLGKRQIAVQAHEQSLGVPTVRLDLNFVTTGEGRVRRGGDDD